MGQSNNTSCSKGQHEHVKKHDHSILGKHTKEEKQKYLDNLAANKKTSNLPNDSDQTNQLEHIKKHDHSILGKHTKKEKEKYLADLANNK